MWNVNIIKYIDIKLFVLFEKKYYKIILILIFVILKNKKNLGKLC